MLLTMTVGLAATVCSLNFIVKLALPILTSEIKRGQVRRQSSDFCLYSQLRRPLAMKAHASEFEFSEPM